MKGCILNDEYGRMNEYKSMNMKEWWIGWIRKDEYERMNMKWWI